MTMNERTSYSILLGRAAEGQVELIMLALWIELNRMKWTIFDALWSSIYCSSKLSEDFLFQQFNAIAQNPFILKYEECNIKFDQKKSTI